jgi:hypothetical protein
VIAAGALFAVAATLAPGFRVRVDAADAARRAEPDRYPASAVPRVFRAPHSERTRVDLLVLASDRLPRWKWMDSGVVSGGRLRLHAPAGATALLVLTDGGDPGYRLDGPFAWPGDFGEREVVPRRARAVSGSSSLVAPFAAPVVAGIPSGLDPLCEADDSGDWQCVGLPRDFEGHVATCRGSLITGAAQVGSGSPSDVSIRPVSFAALLHVDRPEPDPVPSPLSVRVLRPRAAGAFVARSDPRWTVTHADGNRVWIETGAEPPHGPVEVSAAGYATKRFSIESAEARCVDPVAVPLTRSVALTGSVTDPSGAPVGSALVLVRSSAPDERGAVLGDTETDANGDFEIRGLEPVAHRVRACHGEHGCAEEPALPGAPIVLRLSGRGAFIGRVLSGSGVPDPGAVVRILPTAQSWATAEDRIERLPLESRAGPDGRFRITAAGTGDYLVEVRGESGGVCRRAVRKSDLSPAVTDLGDIRLPAAIEFTARLAGCGSGFLHLSGPLGGETSLPNVARFRLDDAGLASVSLPEGGAWTAWASCGGATAWIEPALLPDAAGLAGREVSFERAPEGAGSGKP